MEEFDYEDYLKKNYSSSASQNVPQIYLSEKYKHNCKLWAFDSFCGLPPKSLPEDEHPIWVQGTMSIASDEFQKICRESNIPDSDYHVVAGYYDQTLSNPYGISLPTNICMAYIDCDM
jgi:hypothetical protein